MSFFSCFREQCIQIGSNKITKEDILREIAKLAKKSEVLANISESELFEALSEREAIGTTGFENGLAIPHCRIDGISEFVVGAIIIPYGIDFEALDRKKSEVIFFIIAPNGSDDRDRHIRILSTLSRVYSYKGVKEELLSKGTALEFREAFLRHVSDVDGDGGMEKRCFFHIVIQNEDKFDEILEILSSLFANCSVIEGNDIGSYLHALPLFSSFWNSGNKGFHKVVMGTINRRLVNEMVRSIDSLVDGLERESGVTIAVQELLVAVGSLNL